MLFINYFRTWIEHFEKLPKNNTEPPIWQFTIWNSEANQAVFKAQYYQDRWKTQEYLTLVKDFGGLLQRAYQLSKDRRIDFQLFQTDANDTRIFMAHAGEKYCGLFVAFSPLTTTAVNEGRWALSGFSFQEEKAFRHIAHFNRRLQYRDHTMLDPQNYTAELGDGEQWLRRHYGI